MRMEARIQIGGVTLTEGQAMAVRVALTSFEDELATRDDPISQVYEERLQEVLRLIAHDQPYD
jgi:hypothetical protein